MFDDVDADRFEQLKHQADEAKNELQRIIPLVAEARRSFFRDRSDESRGALEAIEQRAAELGARFASAVQEMQDAVGVSAEDLDELERQERPGDPVARVRREQLTVDKVETSSTIDTLLEASFEKLLAAVGSRQLKEYAALRPPRLIDPDSDEPLSLVRGVRPHSEAPRIHRFAQALLVTQDYVSRNLMYDHFAGAMLVPQVARLADRLDVLRDVPGAAKRLKSLWRRASEEVDSTLFELFVGAGCAANGRSVEFLDATQSKSPDLLIRHQ